MANDDLASRINSLISIMQERPRNRQFRILSAFFQNPAGITVRELRTQYRLTDREFYYDACKGATWPRLAVFFEQFVAEKLVTSRHSSRIVKSYYIPTDKLPEAVNYITEKYNLDL